MEAQLHTGQSFHGLTGITDIDSFDGATGLGLENRPGYRIIVLPDDTADVHVRSDCGELTQSGEDTIRRSARAASPAGRPPIEVAAGHAHEWKDCGSNAAIEVTGNFLVVLWEWDFEIEDAEGRHLFQTGQLPHPALGGLPDVSGTVSQDREAWVFVENGSLSMGIVAGAQHTLYTSTTAALQSNSGFFFRDATGILGIDGYEAEGNQIHMQGHLDLDVVQGDQAQMVAVVQGDLTGLAIDEVSVWFPAQVSRSAELALLPLLFAVAGLGTLVFLALPQVYYRSLKAAQAHKVRGLPGSTWRQRQGSALTVMARIAYERRQPRRALGLARLALCFHPHPQTHIARANAYADLGKARRVDEVHRRLDQCLLGARRERCRNAWHAYQSLRSTDAALAATWYDHARASDFLEFRELADNWNVNP